MSNFSVAQLDEWRATGLPLHSDQAPYSILRPAVASTTCCHGVATHGLGAIAYSPLFRGMLFGTWARDKTFPADDARSTHKDYLGARFQRHLQAVEEIKALARERRPDTARNCASASCSARPALTGCIVGARNAKQGAAIGRLGVTITDEQASAVWEIASALQKDLTGLN